MKKILLATVAAIGLIGQAQIAFANTNVFAKFYICATVQEVDLDQLGYEALTWVEVKGLGNHGESGSNTNIVSYDTWDLTVVQKAKGLTDAGSPEIEFVRFPFDPGQIIMRNAAKTTFNYAFKMLRNDPAYVGGTPTVIYNRGIVTGPRRPFGRNEDFDLEIFTLGFNQLEIIVNPLTAGASPINTVVPAITGTAKVATVLTVSNGTWTGAGIAYTYNWYVGGVLVPGAVANTFYPVAGDIGKIVQARVVATNTAGIAQAFSAATAAVIP